MTAPRRSSPRRTRARASRWVRRTHLYLALALMPWMLMYSLSTLVMNHASADGGPDAGPPTRFGPPETRQYALTLPPDASPQRAAAAVLADLGLEGPHSVRRDPRSGSLVIRRGHPLGDQRITLDPERGELRIQRRTAGAASVLTRLHARKGYGHGNRASDVWALAVDVVVVSMLFWSLSGLWMVWESRATRALGFAALALGGLVFLALFASQGSA